MPIITGTRYAFIFRTPEDHHWMDIAALIASSLPNALVSRLGTHFGALYYKNIASREYSCCYAAFDKTGRLAGVILGTLDHDAAKSLDFILKAKLLLAANIKLFSPAVLRWFGCGWRTRRATNNPTKYFPKAELIVVAVHKDFKGKRVGKRLIIELETFFRESNLDEPYLILTEKSNRVANNLYKKLGAKFIKTYTYHDKLMNEWHKSLS